MTTIINHENLNSVCKFTMSLVLPYDTTIVIISVVASFFNTDVVILVVFFIPDVT